MNVIADKSFQKDISKLDSANRKQILNIVINLTQSESINDIPNFKKIKGFKNMYRIRFGNYRIGIRLNNNTIISVRILHRKDIYKYFPLLF